MNSLIDILGWRNTWRVMVAVVGIGMGLIGFFYRDNPEECSLLMDRKNVLKAPFKKTFI